LIDMFTLSLREAGINPFRVGGDEIKFLGKSEADLWGRLDEAKKLFANKVISHEGKQYTGFKLTGGAASSSDTANSIERTIKKIKQDFREEYHIEIVMASKNKVAQQYKKNYRHLPAPGVVQRKEGVKKWRDAYKEIPDPPLRAKSAEMVTKYKKDLAEAEGKFKKLPEESGEIPKMDIPGKYAGPGMTKEAAEQVQVFRELWKMIAPSIKLPTGRHAFKAEMVIPMSTHGKLVGKLTEAHGLREITQALYEKEFVLRASKLYKKMKNTHGEDAVAEAIETLRGEYPKKGFEPIGHLFTQVERDSIFNHIRTHSTLAKKPITNAAMHLTMKAILDYGHLPTSSELSILNQIFGHKFTGALMKHYPGGGKGAVFLAEFLNAPRTLLTSYDISAAGRQGFFMSLTHPKLGAKAFKYQIRALRNEEYSRLFHKDLTEQPMHKLRQKHKLAIFDPHNKSVSLSERDELFLSNLQQRMGDLELEGMAKLVLGPLKQHGKAVRASERAYLTFLNSLRAQVFDLWANKMIKNGIDPAKRPEVFQELAEFVNAATGRGNPAWFGGKWWGSSLFAPRFLTSAATTIGKSVKIMVNPKMPWKMREMAIRHGVQGTTEALLLAGLIKTGIELYGGDATVNLDNKSSDFGRVVEGGRTRIDFFGRYRNEVRLFSTVIYPGEKTNVKTGVTRKLTPREKGLELFNFARGKLAPYIGGGISLLWGETPTREKATLGRVAYGAHVPLIFQAMVNIGDEHGALGLLLLTPLEGVGLPVGVYDIKQPIKPGEAMKKLAESMQKPPAGLGAGPARGLGTAESARRIQEAMKNLYVR